ncbi:ketopantoate reductase family protein [Chengkuizengella marina]|uniref:2-dehydropantoate 2-reductase n=1 Tax=Chengkuizengella marina TaxID=2507566 RepID=A0A6N9Q683_9BACL|nr:2-dehydropantoate 2-reductase [Chengkuizengella marina]NBI30193.1 ketopantoate reductase family protein [Chengkuizengella marina]
MGSVEKNLVILGAGAIGGTLGAWLSPKYKNTYMLDRDIVAKELKNRGIIAYQQGEKEKVETIRVQSISDLSELERVDIVVLAVKNYSLDSVAQAIHDKLDENTIIVALQNGVENQRILPKYFKKIIYGVVSYNAWIDEPCVIGYQKKGPFIVGTPDNSLRTEIKLVSDIFNLGVETVITDQLLNAAHSKMIVNLTNSFTTLVGHGYREISHFRLFKKILIHLLYEGVEIIKASGYKECRLGDMPSWLTMTVAVKLPHFLTDGIFRKNLSKMVMSSMGQDIIQHGKSDSELESLNGYFIHLADMANLKAPYNRAIYKLCKEGFKKTPFQPLDVEKVWEKVEQEMNK